MKNPSFIFRYISLVAMPFFLVQCNANSAHKEDDMLEVNIPTTIKVEDAISHLDSKVLNIPIGSEDIVSFELSNNSLLGEFSIQDIVYDKILLQSGNSLFAYQLPSGKFLHQLSKLGEGNGEYRNIAAAVFASNDIDIAVLESRWQDDFSNIIVFDRAQTIVSRTQIPLIGDLIRLRQKNMFVAPNTITFTGGDSKLYYVNGDFQIVDSVECNKHYSEREVFKIWESIDKLGSVPAVILRDTLFNISSDYSLTPILHLDYNGKGVPDNFSLKNYKNYDQYINAYAEMIYPTQLQKLGDKLYARLEYNNKVYYSIWDSKTGKLLYSKQAKDSEWGMKLHIGESSFNQWPIGEWNEKLIFYIPDYIISEITEDEDSNPGLAFVPINQIDSILSRL